jgi:beta-N-acetylhexosaminidase
MRICHEIGWLMASELVASGIDISFAPVLDVDRETSSIIGNRSFSNDPKLLIKLARNFINGMNEAGMQATGKHFPGHGGIFEDSHISEPVDYQII